MKTFYVLEPHVNGTTKYERGGTREADENEVKHLVDLKVLGTDPPKTAPDYERDSLKAVDLKKATRAQLLVIAAYEHAGVPQDDLATDAELLVAIQKKRQG